MEDRVLNEKESIELITRMITQTKRKFETSDGNILIQWGWLTIAVAAIVMIALIVTEEPAANALWAMMALGSFFNRKKHNDDKTRGHTTYTDAISANIWKLAGFAFLPAAAICVAVDLFMPDLADYAVNSIWLLFYITALVAIGIIAAVQGIIIKVGCLVFGGTFSAVAGICVVAAALCQIPVTPYWGYPLMMPATAEGNKSNGKVDSRMGARRMPYPQVEYTTNGENVRQAVASWLNGGDDMATRLWWDCKEDLPQLR